LLEDTIDSATFSSKYDARIEIATGKIELQRAALVDLGGVNYQASAVNTGDGYLTSLTLLDTNAPAETWTIRCSSVLRDGSGNPRRYQASLLLLVRKVDKSVMLTVNHIFGRVMRLL
jgi:hypothetical protein